MKAGFQVRGKWSSPKMADNEHDNNDDDLGGGGTTTGVITRTKPKTKKPSLFTYEVAETKVAQVVDFARQNQHPLQCTMERE